MSVFIRIFTVIAAVALSVAAVGVAVAAPAAPTPITPPNADVFPRPAVEHPSEALDAGAAAPVLDPVGEFAVTLEADPPQDALEILDFTVSNTVVLCNLEAPHEAPQHIAFTWNVVGAERVFFGVDTTDAQAQPMFVDLPHAGSSHTEFPAGYEDYTYACPEPAHRYTLTAVDDQGHAISRNLVVVNEGDTY